jgi:UDP-GlcNAc3NAcA epimerase
MPKLISIIGARPQFIKIAPLAQAIDNYNLRASESIDHLIIHTGQHYDPGMSEIFFEELKIPRACINLEVGSASHGRQTGQMLEKVEQVLLETQPGCVVIFGDTNSTVAGALAAAKLHIPVAHVEAGLRSYNRRMPEEINRVVSDHIADLLLAPTPTAVANLHKEGVFGEIVFTGDIMLDAVLYNREIAEKKSTLLQRLGLNNQRFLLATVHRAENTDEDNRLEKLLASFQFLADLGWLLVFPIHPRTRNILKTKFPDWPKGDQVKIIEPVGYLDMLSLVGHAAILLTDSGGLQKEAFFLGCPCITLREETEWVETVQGDGNLIAGVEPEKITDAVKTWEKRVQAGFDRSAIKDPRLFGDGNAAFQTLTAIVDYLAKIGG